MELEPALLLLYLETQRKEMEPEQRIRRRFPDFRAETNTKRRRGQASGFIQLAPRGLGLSSRNLYESKCVGDCLFTHLDICTNQDVLILEILAFPMSASSQEVVGSLLVPQALRYFWSSDAWNKTTMNNRSKAHVYFSSGNVLTTMFGLMADCLYQ
ncbi:hypothetical protein MRB53_033808 [Persea americana]|uniref:Uncharacterized protein n=1 Tax=Persea americana TaxID=3435 RepID=A0ACC2KW00_PERAE|nr:hypothetical protein MRB53_033808 [Persea americana]